MEGNDSKPRAQLQAQATEVAIVRDEVERNHTSSADRPRLGKKPVKGEGRDGDSRFVKEGGKMYVYHKINGSWYRVEVARA